MRRTLLLNLFVALSIGSAVAKAEPPGQTTISVFFPKAVRAAPLTFGIPLRQASSPDQVRVLDEKGKAIPADLMPLGNWKTQPHPWALISCVVSAEQENVQRQLIIECGSSAGPEPEDPLTCKTVKREAGDGAENFVIVGNSTFTITIGAAGVQSVSCGGKTATFSRWRPAFVPYDKNSLTPREGSIKILYDGLLYKKIRVISALSEALDLHQEFDIYSGSPYIRCAMRFINRSLKDIHLDGIAPAEIALEGIEELNVGVGANRSASAKQFEIRQANVGWTATLDGKTSSGQADNLGEWVWARLNNGMRLMWVFPYFQEMAGGEDELASTLGYDGKTLRLWHYRRISPKADVRLRETMARTFFYWFVLDTDSSTAPAVAEAVKAMPHVIYDRAYLTKMDVFQEKAVSHLFDREVLEAALYYKRAQVPRIEYPRSSRGATPKKHGGEGFGEVNMFAGGMVFGEVYQYFTPNPDEGLIKTYQEKGFDLKHIITGGKCAYRNGDIPRALVLQYLRSGDRKLSDLMRIHTQLFADYSVSHHRGNGSGVGHYYCGWYGNPYVYQRFEGLLLGYLATGERWWFETAKDMADVCVRSWKNGHARDIGMNGGMGGAQNRSAYIGKMLMRMYDVSGEKKYMDTACRLGKWVSKWQEKEGWWTMGPRDLYPDHRKYRCGPIPAGYISNGLWPVYWRTRDEELKETLLKTGRWYISRQEDARGENPGTFPNSYWYGDFIKADQPISGNYAATSHAANALLNCFLVTGDREFFYSANAAWVGVLNHQTPEGGVPLGNSKVSSVWSHVMVEALPNFAARAEELKLPIVMDSRNGVPGTSFMGKGASYDGKVFRFELKYKYDKPQPVRIFTPSGKPTRIVSNEKDIAFKHDLSHHIVRFHLPASKDFTVSQVEVHWE